MPLEDVVRRGGDGLDSLHPRAVLNLQRTAGNQAVIQLARPSPEERKRLRRQQQEQKLTKRLYESADKKGRTRQAKKVEEQLKGKGKEQILELALANERKNKPPTALELAGQQLFSGNRDFGAEFRKQYWENQPSPWTCTICHDVISPRGKRGNAPSIDHRQEWSIISTGVRTFQVCKNGVHWEVSLDDEAQAANKDLSNLRPTHKGCNSSKSGQKGNDPLMPITKGPCTGNCTLEKAI